MENGRLNFALSGVPYDMPQYSSRSNVALLKCICCGFGYSFLLHLGIRNIFMRSVYYGCFYVAAISVDFFRLSSSPIKRPAFFGAW